MRLTDNLHMRNLIGSMGKLSQGAVDARPERAAGRRLPEVMRQGVNADLASHPAAMA
jgi:hypothetical protein